MTSFNNNSYKYPVVYIFSEKTDLLNDTIDILKNNRCEIVIISPEGFSKKELDNLYHESSYRRCYFLFLLNALHEDKLQSVSVNIKALINVIEKVDSKTILVFPRTYKKTYEVFYSYWRKSVVENNKIYKGVVYLGDLLSESPGTIYEGYLDTIIANIATFKKVPSDVENIFFNPLSPNSASEILASLLFSMSAYNTETSVMGKRISLGRLVDMLFENNKSGLEIKGKLFVSRVTTNKESRIVDEDIEKLITTIGEWSLSKNRITNNMAKLEQREKRKKGLKNIFFKIPNLLQKVLVKINPNVIKSQEEPIVDTYQESSFRRYRLIKVVTIAVTVMIISPFMLIEISQASLLSSSFFMKNNNIKISSGILKISKLSSEGAKHISNLFMKAPLVGYPYGKLSNNSESFSKITDLQEDYIEILNDIALFIKQTDSEDSHDNLKTVRNISLSIDSIYTKTGFLEGEALKDNAKLYSMQSRMFPGANTTKTKKRLLLLNKIFGRSDFLLGSDKPSNYLLLFEDNSEIRPTGGKIYAYGVMTVSNGKISDIQFFNFEDVDKNIIGKIEPPEPLKKYFSKDFWYLSDSNWYSDFPSSAEKAEWFLDKGLDISVNGVISFDTTAMTRFSTVVGKDSLFSENNPKPDEIRELLKSLVKQNDSKTYRLIFELYSLLDEKHILVFVHDNKTRIALNDLGWDGSIKSVDCANDCFLDPVGFIESANGLGSENIKKDVTLRISMEEGLIKKTLDVYMENKNNFNYKTYVRALTNANSGFSPIKITTEENEEEKHPDIYGVSGYKEAGIYLEFKPLETKRIRFFWENSFNNTTDLKRYSVLFRKQPGESEYPIEIDFNSNSKEIVRSSPSYSLTSDGVWSYNTNLLNDFESDFFLK